MLCHAMLCYGQVFVEHEELRKTLWRPRYTPVSFSLLMTAASDAGPDTAERLQRLPRILELMEKHGVLPRTEACERMLDACTRSQSFDVGEQVLAVAERAERELDPVLVGRYRRAALEGRSSRRQYQLPRQPQDRLRR